MGKTKYPISKIRSDYSYTLIDVANLFDVSKATVSRWIKDEGLKYFESSKRHFIYGSNLRVFIQLKNNRNKSITPADQIHCHSCRRPRDPTLDSLGYEQLVNGAIRVYALCSYCENKLSKFISINNWNEKNHFYNLLEAPSKTLIGEFNIKSECEPQKELK